MHEMIKQGYIGNPDQLCSVRRVQLQEGKGKGCEIIEIFTAGGLQVDILPDTGLDIGQVRYRGINMTEPFPKNRTRNGEKKWNDPAPIRCAV